jgi:hypothetical protein
MPGGSSAGILSELLDLGESLTMKYNCGARISGGWVLCRIAEQGRDRFRVEIRSPRGELLARSNRALNTRKTMDFIVEEAQARCAVPRFHFEARAV